MSYDEDEIQDDFGLDGEDDLDTPLEDIPEEIESEEEEMEDPDNRYK